MRAAFVPACHVADRASYIERTNSYRFMMVDAVWNLPGVSDVTPRLSVIEI